VRYYIYVLQSESDGKFYVGFTQDIEKMLKEHMKGKVSSTEREKYLKTAWGKRYIKNRIKHYLTG